MDAIATRRQPDHISAAFVRLEHRLRQQAPAPATDATLAVYNSDDGSCVHPGLPHDVAVAEVERMNLEANMLMDLLRAYVEGGVSFYVTHRAIPVARLEDAPC